MDVNSAALNPMLYYKLDPGEWGSSAPATAGTSISHVASHESSNILRFESEAAKNGCYIIAKDLFLNLQQNGMYLSATSGKSSVITYCPEREKEQAIKGNLGSRIDRRIQQYTKEQIWLDTLLKALKSKVDKGLLKQKLKSIESRKIELQQKKLRLYTEITLLLAQNLQINPEMLNIDLMV